MSFSVETAGPQPHFHSMPWTPVLISLHCLCVHSSVPLFFLSWVVKPQLIKCQASCFFFFLFFPLSWVVKPQLNHCDRWVINNKLNPSDPSNCPRPLPAYLQWQTYLWVKKSIVTSTIFEGWPVSPGWPAPRLGGDWLSFFPRQGVCSKFVMLSYR